GIDLELLKEIKEVRRGRLVEYAQLRGNGVRLIEGGSIWDVPCQIALPSATQNELDERDAKQLLTNGLEAIAEGANMPCTPQATALFQSSGCLYGPGKAANAGGVATSALEMQQNASRNSWTFEKTEERLEEIMTSIHTSCLETADEYGDPGNYVMGANLFGYIKVANAMVAMGVV